MTPMVSNGTPPAFMPDDCAFHASRNWPTCAVLRFISVVRMPLGRDILAAKLAAALLMPALVESS